MCNNANADFIDACLSNTSNPDMTICDGAPANPALLAEHGYAIRVCERYGWDPDMDTTANNVVSAIEHWCAVNR